MMSENIRKEPIVPVMLRHGGRAAIATKIRDAMPLIASAVERNMTWFGQRFPEIVLTTTIWGSYTVFPVSQAAN